MKLIVHPWIGNCVLQFVEHCKAHRKSHLFQKQRLPPSPCLQFNFTQIYIICSSTFKHACKEREKGTYAHWHHTKSIISATALHLMQQGGNAASSCLWNPASMNFNKNYYAQIKYTRHDNTWKNICQLEGTPYI